MNGNEREKKKITWPKKGTTHFKILWHFFRTVSQNFTFNSIYFRLFTAYFCSGFFIFPVQRITTTSNYTYIYTYIVEKRTKKTLYYAHKPIVCLVQKRKKRKCCSRFHMIASEILLANGYNFFLSVLPFSVSFHLVHCVDQWHEKKNLEKKGIESKWTNELYFSVENVNAMIFARAAHTRCDSTQQLCFIYTRARLLDYHIPCTCCTMHIESIRSYILAEHNQCTFSLTPISHCERFRSVHVHNTHTATRKMKNRRTEVKRKQQWRLLLPLPIQCWKMPCYQHASKPTNRSSA